MEIVIKDEDQKEVEAMVQIIIDAIQEDETLRSISVVKIWHNPFNFKKLIIIKRRRHGKN